MNEELKIWLGRWIRNSIIWVFGVKIIFDLEMNRYLMGILMITLLIMYISDTNRGIVPNIYLFIIKCIHKINLIVDGFLDS